MAKDDDYHLLPDGRTELRRKRAAVCPDSAKALSIALVTLALVLCIIVAKLACICYGTSLTQLAADLLHAFPQVPGVLAGQPQ